MNTNIQSKPIKVPMFVTIHLHFNRNVRIVKVTLLLGVEWQHVSFKRRELIAQKVEGSYLKKASDGMKGCGVEEASSENLFFFFSLAQRTLFF